MDDWAWAQWNAQMAAQQAAQQAAAQAQFNAQMAAQQVQQAAAQAAWAAQAAAQQTGAQKPAQAGAARQAAAQAQNAQDRAQVDATIRAYHSDFGQTPALREVWERAISEQPDTRRGYDAARDEFWKILHNESDQDASAHAVRQMLELAGYNFGRGEGAPILDLLPHSNTSISTKQLQLSTDHADLGSKGGGWLSAHNLRFMLTDDSVEGNARFNAKDVPFKGWEWPRQRPRHRSELN